MRGYCKYKKTRVRLCRPISDTVFGGWVVDVNRERIIVRSSDSHLMTQGETLAFEIEGFRENLTGYARLIGISKTTLVFKLEGEPEVIESNENARVFVENMPAELVVNGLNDVAGIIDISVHGVGLISHSELKRGDEVKISFNTPAGALEAIAEVRHCKMHRAEFFERHIGLKLKFPDRVTQMKWRAQFAEWMNAA